MNRRTLAISTPTLLLALAIGAAAPASAQDSAWQLELSGVYVESTAGDAPDGSFGGGLSLEYRATPRLGFALGVLTAEFEEEIRGEIFGFELITETELGITPVLARLDLHLTPDRRADVYLGPVAGYVLFDDLAVRARATFPGPTPVDEQASFRTEDQLTWGAHAGVDVRLGGPGGRSYLTAGVTYLDLPIEVEVPTFDDDTGEVGLETSRGDLDPLIVHLGFGFRF